MVETEIPTHLSHGKPWTPYRFENLVVPSRCPPGGNPFLARRVGIRRFLEIARRLEPSVVRGRGRSNIKQLAAQENLSTVRVCQMLQLLKLAPEILADLEDPTNNGPTPREDELRQLASVHPASKQVEEFKRAVEALRDWGY